MLHPPQTRIIQIGEIDDDGLGLALRVIEGHPKGSIRRHSEAAGTGPSSSIPRLE